MCEPLGEIGRAREVRDLTSLAVLVLPSSAGGCMTIAPIARRYSARTRLLPGLGESGHIGPATESGGRRRNGSLSFLCNIVDLPRRRVVLRRTGGSNPFRNVLPRHREQFIRLAGGQPVVNVPHGALPNDNAFAIG